MPSKSLSKYKIAKANAQRLASKEIINSSALSNNDRQLFYHAALASIVAAWEAYVEAVCREFVVSLNTRMSSEGRIVLAIFADQIEEKIRKFNTANFDNSRRIFIEITGYDPINDWIWAARSYNRQQTTTFLNEVLQIRHCFAHGVPLKILVGQRTILAMLDLLRNR